MPRWKANLIKISFCCGLALCSLQGVGAEEPTLKRYSPRLFQPQSAQPLVTIEEPLSATEEKKPWIGKRVVNSLKARLTSEESVSEDTPSAETVGTFPAGTLREFPSLETGANLPIPEEPMGAPPAERNLPRISRSMPKPMQAPGTAREILPWEQPARRSAEETFTGVFLPPPVPPMAQNETELLPELLPMVQPNPSEPVVPPLPEDADPQLRKITEIQPFVDYFPKGENPDLKDMARPDRKEFMAGPYVPRPMGYKGYAWQASNLWHNPLYFEDPTLERYGHKYPEFLQPVGSITRFGVQLVGLPYQMTLDQVHSRKYVLGWYRPGDCAPKLHYQVPLNGHAALMEAGVVTGLIYFIP